MASPDVRHAEPLAAFSLVSDMAPARRPGEAMRACLVATHLARSMGVSDRGVVWQFVGDEQSVEAFWS